MSERSSDSVVNSQADVTNMTTDTNIFKRSYHLLFSLFPYCKSVCILSFPLYLFLYSSLFGCESRANNRFINRPMKPQIEAVW